MKPCLAQWEWGTGKVLVGVSIKEGSEDDIKKGVRNHCKEDLAFIRTSV